MDKQKQKPSSAGAKDAPFSQREKEATPSLWERVRVFRVSGEVFLFFFIFLIWLLGFSSHAATWLDPSLKWKTLETPHFSINYYAEIEDTAKRIAPIAEEVHATMSKVFKYKIDMKTQMTLLDTTDFGNGFTTVFPYPSITLYLTDLGSNLNPYKYDNYLRFLFLHEYAHALHLDIAGGAGSIFRLIFGRNYFPNAVEPWFLIEGMATYMETRYTNAGRGRDPRWEMMMRMDVLEDNLKSIDQAAVDTVKWPMGHLRYLYGVEFIQYLAETYGEDKLITLAHVYGDFLYSMGIDGAFIFLYQKNLSLLWNEWLDHLNEKFKLQKSKLGKLTEQKLLTRSGYYNLKPKWSKDSRMIYYIQRDADDYPQIRGLDLADGRSEKIFEGMVFDEGLSLSPDGKTLLFSKADTYKNYYTFKDIYALDLGSRALVKLTDGLRASDPCYSPDGKKIAFVRNEKGSKMLWLAELKDGSEPRINSRFANSFAGSQYFSPSFSPDGKSIAVAKRTTDGRQKIYLIDVGSGSEKALIKDDSSSTEANPCFFGDHVVFDSDRTGIVNLYAYNLISKKLFQLTNVLGGAMMPDASPDGKRLAYVSYSSRGYDIAVMDIDPSSWKEIVLEPETKVSVHNGTANLFAGSQTYEVHDYNPWPSLLPRFWVPYDYNNENGNHTSIYIGSTDPLRQHIYYLNYGYDFNGNKPSGTFYYVNDQFLPRITTSFSDLSVAYDWSAVPAGRQGKTYWEREREGALLFSFYDNRALTEYDRQVATVGFQTANLTNISTIDSFSPRPNLGNINSLLVAWRYLSTRAYPYSISPEDGIDLSLKTEISAPALKSDYNFTNYSAALSNFFKMPVRHQVLASKLSGFYSKGEQLEQSNFTWRYLSVRGYPSTTLKGNKGASLSLEYRFPLFYLEWGLMYGTTFFDRVWGKFFFDAGGATLSPLDRLTVKKGIGAELNLETSTFWGFYAFAFKLGYARGLDQGGEEKFYFTLGL